MKNCRCAPNEESHPDGIIHHSSFFILHLDSSFDGIWIEHAGTNFICFFLATEMLHDGITETESGTRTFAKEELVVANDELTCRGSTLEFTFEARVAGGLSAFQQTHASVNEWSSTDGTEWFSCFVLCKTHFAQTFVCVKIDGSRHAARKEYQCYITIVEFLKEGIGDDRNIVSTDYTLLACCGNGDNWKICTTANVDDTKCFDVLEAWGKEYIYLFHRIMSMGVK